ncbi:hypothetical protein [Paenibacillus gorillae]|uniref:hypothetical protein n=1 Tax=Paenibacillus gorillae TaxID=1243662 RepID=UPI0004B1F019|nr:hypothetical protein [Paenibacillus gorillae]
MKLLSEYVGLNLWLLGISIVFFAYDGTITPVEGTILLFLVAVCIINLSKIMNYLFGVKNNP